MNERDKAIVLEEFVEQMKGKYVAVDKNHKAILFGDDAAKVHMTGSKNPNYLFTIRITKTDDYCKC